MPENPELLLVFGTSADPFHLGHASLVVQAVKELAVRGQRTRQVVIMPIFRHHNILDNVKRSLPPTYQHRFDICQLFTEQIAADLGALVADVRVSDLERRLDQMIPWDDPDDRHGEGNTAAHLKAALVGTSAAVFIEEGRLQLGTWQGVFFCEFDGPRTREVWLSFSPAAP